MTPLVNSHQTHASVYTHTHTYANNKELRRHGVTLETLTNKHTCGQAHTWSSSHKLRVTLVFMKREKGKQTEAPDANKHVDV